LEGKKPQDSVWKPLRAKLGIEAFGINAFVGREVGARVIEDHSEEGSAHQELYVVLAGNARSSSTGRRSRPRPARSSSSPIRL